MEVKGWDGAHIPLVSSVLERDHELVIMIHGIFSEKEEDGRFTRLAERLQLSGVSTVRYDQRCHGASKEPKENLSVANHVLDFISIIEECRRHSEKISVIASSYGAAIALLASSMTSEAGIRKYILLNPVLDFDYVFIKPLGSQISGLIDEKIRTELNSMRSPYIINGVTFTPAFWAELHYTKPSIYLSSIAKDTVIIHGDADTAVDYERTKCISATAGVSKFYTIKGSDHSFVLPQHEVEAFSRIEENFF